jgi:hypothetical protein
MTNDKPSVLELWVYFPHLQFGLGLTFACLREVPPCGTKPEILSFEL